MEKYIPILEKINECIEEFNSYLQPNFGVGKLDISRISDQDYFLNIAYKKWVDFRFPRNNGVGGVYFYIGEYLDFPGKQVLYIGKASLNSFIGRRLSAHFIGKCNGEKVIIKDCNIELITSLPFEDPNLVFLAPALEEYLIVNMQKHKEITLFNDRGNKVR